MSSAANSVSSCHELSCSVLILQHFAPLYDTCNTLRHFEILCGLRSEPHKAVMRRHRLPWSIFQVRGTVVHEVSFKWAALLYSSYHFATLCDKPPSRSSPFETAPLWDCSNVDRNQVRKPRTSLRHQGHVAGVRPMHPNHKMPSVKNQEWTNVTTQNRADLRTLSGARVQPKLPIFSKEKPPNPGEIWV